VARLAIDGGGKMVCDRDILTPLPCDLGLRDLDCLGDSIHSDGVCSRCVLEVNDVCHRTSDVSARVELLLVLIETSLGREGSWLKRFLDRSSLVGGRLP
jgi:hypothetical protein